MGFNLIDQPFIPVLRDGGRRPESIRSLFSSAGQIREFAPIFPSQAPAFLRQLILPIVLGALGPPRSGDEWRQRFQQRGFTQDELETIGRYLDKYRARFELFHDTQPFAQVGGLTTGKGETKPISLLIPAMASGNNVPLFSNRTDADTLGITPADAVAWLLHTHCWDTAAIKTGAIGDPQAKAGKTTGNPTGPLGQLGLVVPTGRNLFETIMLNTPIVRSGRTSFGVPHWEREPATAEWETRAAKGLLDLLTWQSRRIRLFTDSGDFSDSSLVTRVIVSAGDRLAETPPYDPHTAWRIDSAPKNNASPRRPRRHVAGKAAWRGLDALLALGGVTADDSGKSQETSALLTQIGELRVDNDLPADYPLQVHTHGMVYGTQSAVFDDSIADSLPLPISALTTTDATRDVLLEVAQQAEDLASALNRLGGDLRRAQGGEPLPWDRGQRPGDIAIHSFDRAIRRLFAGLQAVADDADKIEQGRLAWEQTARAATLAVADSVLQSTPPTVFCGRTKDKRHYSEATAEATFRGQVKKILTRLYADQQIKRGA